MKKKAMFIAALAISAAIAVPAAAAVSVDASKVTDDAIALIGSDYAYGGADPDKGFDSSGLIYYVLKKEGVTDAARKIADQVKKGTPVNAFDDLEAGDAVYFSNEKGGTTAAFGGIYIGDGKMVYSATDGVSVQQVSIDTKYWKGVFVVGIRN
ncbi:hypothetical protein AGMMS49975_25740 [Clostridia bacterium]|nr:hypothetical protein AGMMS49975_25740 [Clostridia bacterium]